MPKRLLKNHPFKAIGGACLFYGRGVTGFVSGLTSFFLLEVGYFWADFLSDPIKG